MGPADLAIAAVILGLAVWLLWRSAFRRGGGGCHGCSGAGCGRASEPDGLVKLGRRAR